MSETWKVVEIEGLQYAIHRDGRVGKILGGLKDGIVHVLAVYERNLGVDKKLCVCVRLGKVWYTELELQKLASTSVFEIELPALSYFMAQLPKEQREFRREYVPPDLSELDDVIFD